MQVIEDIYIFQEDRERKNTAYFITKRKKGSGDGALSQSAFKLRKVNNSCLKLQNIRAPDTLFL